MSIRCLLAPVLLLAAIASAQTARPTGATIAPLLGFENNQVSDDQSKPRGWGVSPAGTAVAVTDIVHTGKWAARITRTSNSAQLTSTLYLNIPVDFVGTSITLRGYLRTENVTGYAALYSRLDSDRDNFSLDPRTNSRLSGTRNWAAYELTIPYRHGAKQLLFAAVLRGSGTVWVDDLQLLVDGKPIWRAPKNDHSVFPMDTDHEFDRSSGIKLNSLTPVQIENLVILGKVWGFAKYYDHRVITGKRQWDFDLFRVLPSVLAAPDSATGREAIVEWLKALGPITPCVQCRVFLDLDPSLQLSPPIAWVSDPAVVGKPLADLLTSIKKQRPIDGNRQFYVSLATGIQNPIFDYELPYPIARNAYPESGFQLLALYRLWNMVEYWFPNRNILPENWDSVLREFIPKVALAKTRDEYNLQMMAFIAKLGDTHAALWSAIEIRPPVGSCDIPVMFRFIDNQPVVWEILPSGKGSPLQRGDVLLEIDGRPIPELLTGWTPFYAASNQPARLRDIAGALSRGACGPVNIRIMRGTEASTLSVLRSKLPQGESPVNQAHDLPGDAFRLLSPDVAYLKISTAKVADIPDYLMAAQNTKGWVIDIRNYPSDNMALNLAPHLVEERTPYSRATVGDLSNPGAFHWTEPFAMLPQEPHYPGKVVVLVDEVTQSAAEYTSMIFRATGATVVGSTTSGADGNVSQIQLPGGLTTMFSGIGIFYPDKSPTQQIGIVPDIVSRPTIAGIAAGRDEVLETAVRLILGDQASQEKVQAITKP